MVEQVKELTNLLENENIIDKMALTKAVLIWPPFLILLSLIVFTIGIVLGPSGYGYAIFSGFLFWFAVLLLITARLDYSTAHLYLTNKRIILKAGYIRKVSQEILLDKVQGIDVDQSVTGRLFNYGSIRIKGIGVNNIIFKNTREPYEFRSRFRNKSRVLLEEKSKEEEWTTERLH